MPELRWILALAGIGIVFCVYWYSRRRSEAGDRADAEARVEPGFSSASEAETFASGPSKAEADPRLVRGDVLPPIRIGDDAETDVFEGLSASRDDSDGETTPIDEVLAATDVEDLAEAVAGLESADASGAGLKASSGSEHAVEDERVVAIRLKAKRPEGFDGATLLRAFKAGNLKFGRFDIFHRESAAGPPAFSVASIVEPGSFDLETLPTTGCPGVTLFMILPGPAEPVLALDDMLAVARSLAADLDGELLDERGVSLTAQREAHLREEIAEHVRRQALMVSQGRSTRA